VTTLHFLLQSQLEIEDNIKAWFLDEKNNFAYNWMIGTYQPLALCLSITIS